MKAFTIVSILVLGSGAAHADNKAKADELFKHAKRLLGEKKYAQACPQFEESYRLDPGIGGKLNVGRCYEEWGKLAHAYRAYSEAEAQAKEASDSREGKIHELVAGIEPQVPHLLIHVPPGVDPSVLAVTIDGAVIATGDLGNPQLVDPGPKDIEYVVAGVKRSKLVPVERGSTAEVTLDVPKAGDGEHSPAPHEPADKQPPPPVAPAAPEPPGHTQRLGGIALGAAGIVGLGVGSYLALSARSSYNSALAADCMGMKNLCDPAGLTATHDARSRANVATIVGGVGLAAIAGGVVLYLLAPHAAASEHAFYVVPTANGGLAFGGRL